LNGGLGFGKERGYGHIWTTTNRPATGRQQYAYVEMNALTSGTKGKPFSSFSVKK